MQKFDFIKNQKIFFIISIVIISIGIIFFFINGLNLDIQFIGGTRIQIETNSEVNVSDVEAVVEEAVGKSITAQMLKTYGAGEDDKTVYMLRMDIASEETLTDEERTLVINTVINNFDVKENGSQEIVSVEPSIGRETLEKGLLAVIIASVLIIFYVTWRFSAMHGFAAAITALVALLHDILIVFSLYVVFKIPMGEIFITAMLTILGYSLNDTIVVYDRIRENSKLMSKNSLDEIVNSSLYQSLRRIINTTVTTLLAIVTLYIFAAVNNITSLMEFSLPLIVGFVAGTYSSLFIASPLWLMWRKASMHRRQTKKA